jgi:F1F0 ATPase subunit 2
MNETIAIALAWLAGVGLGAIFFGGLWWTVRKASSSPRPASWFLGSALLRMGIALAGFYLVTGPDWRQPLACLFGFVMARLIVIRLTRPAIEESFCRPQEASHAP